MRRSKAQRLHKGMEADVLLEFMPAVSELDSALLPLVAGVDENRFANRRGRAARGRNFQDGALTDGIARGVGDTGLMFLVQHISCNAFLREVAVDGGIQSPPQRH